MRKNRKANGRYVIHPRIVRMGALILVIFSLLLIPVLIFGDRFEVMLDGDKALSFLRSLGPWSGVIAIGMIMADLVLPLPAPTIMAGLGLIYGPVVGGILAGIGSYSAGLLAYSLCRLFGQRAAVYIAGQDDINRISTFFARHGVWAIALSRWAPVLPEILSCLAGLTRMPFWRFTFGNVVGSFAVGFAYAYFGAKGENNPGGVILISFLAPLLVLPMFLFILSPARNKSAVFSKTGAGQSPISSETGRDNKDKIT